VMITYSDIEITLNNVTASYLTATDFIL
jgi:hypothetical protein